MNKKHDKTTCEDGSNDELTNSKWGDDELFDFEWVEDVKVLTLVDVIPSSVLISTPCLNLKILFSNSFWLFRFLIWSKVFTCGCDEVNILPDSDVASASTPTADSWVTFELGFPLQVKSLINGPNWIFNSI